MCISFNIIFSQTTRPNTLVKWSWREISCVISTTRNGLLTRGLLSHEGEATVWFVHGRALFNWNSAILNQTVQCLLWKTMFFHLVKEGNFQLLGTFTTRNRKNAPFIFYVSVCTSIMFTLSEKLHTQDNLCRVWDQRKKNVQPPISKYYKLFVEFQQYISILYVTMEIFLQNESLQINTTNK